jgi:hypothetical protein
VKKDRAFRRATHPQKIENH